MELIRDLVRVERLSPPVAARVDAYSGITLYEAVLPGMPGFQSLAGQLNEMPAMPPVQLIHVTRSTAALRLYLRLAPRLSLHMRHPKPELWGPDWPTVAAVAASQVTLGLFPDGD